MADDAQKNTAQKRTESVLITVAKCKELKGQRGDQLTAVFKLEYGEKILGESQKVDTVAGQKQFDVNFTSTFTLNVEDAVQLDEICYKPFTCTILEMLPREKKQKEDKFVTLGQCAFDIWPVLQGALNHEVNLIIHPVAGSPLEHLKPDEPKPEITVNISVNEAIFTEAEAGQFNIMRIIVGSLFSPPEPWLLSTPQQQPHLYIGAMPAPFSVDKDQALVFSAGALKTVTDKDPPDRRLRWYQANKMTGGSQFIPESQLPNDPIDQEDGDYKSKDDAEFRRVAEQERSRICWNTERRCFIDQAVEKRLQDRIAQCRYWPLEIFRLQPPSTNPQKKAGAKPTEDEFQISYHGVAYLNLAHLLYPGVKRIRGVFKIDPFYDVEVQEKAKVKGTLIGDVTKQLFGIVRMNSGLAKAGKGEKKEPVRRDKADAAAALGNAAAAGNKPGAAKGGPAQAQPANQANKAEGDNQSARKDGEINSAEETNPEGQSYREAKSYIYVDITLQRPLIKKRTREEQLVRVSDIIPPRPLYPRKVCGADRAVTDYHKQISVVAGQVVEEFRRLFADELSLETYDTSHEAIENRRTKLVEHLSESGRYYIFRERLKYAIVKIVREKYLKTGAFENEDEYQSFLSDLYTYLVDEMRTALNKFLDVDSGKLDLADQPNNGRLVPNFTLGSEQLKQFAKEAEIIGDYELANRYYQERLARDRADADSWFDYGMFVLSLNELVKAEECFRECLSISRMHLDGLIMCGVVATLLEEHQLALTCFETVTVVDPENVVAWTLLALYYEAAGNDIGMEMALGEAERLANAKQAAILQQLQPSQPPSQPQQSQQPPVQPALSQAPAAVAGNVPPIAPAAESAPSSQPAPHQATTDAPIAATDSKHAPAPPAAPPGKVAKKPGLQPSQPPNVGPRPAQSATVTPDHLSHSHVPPQPPPPGKFVARAEVAAQEGKAEFQTIFMHTALYLLQHKAFTFTERALAHHMLHPNGGSSPHYLEVLAKLCFDKREFSLADGHITEALKVNYRKADAWALCGHIKYMLGDDISARQSYERSLAFESDPSDLQEIYIRLGMVYLRQEEFQQARDTFLLACKRQPSAITWLGVGIGCYRLEQYADAESALCEANLLNNYDPVIWAYLSLVSLKTGRRLEAEQAYKFCRKLRLKDDKLLNELTHIQEEVGFGNPEFATTQ